ncbi:MAG: DUF2892 domain-containing protein [Thermodesulfobacteriota bacterium]
MSFRCNVGGAERTARIVIGLLLIALAAFEVVSGAIRLIGFVAGAVLLLTGAIKWCMLWEFLGINTCKTGEKAL